MLLGVTDEHRAVMDKFLPLVYDDLRARARRYLRPGADRNVMQPTALVHEAYLKLIESGVDFGGRTHVLAVAAIAMRQVLIDHIRGARSAKRGGDAVAVTLNDAVAFASGVDLDVFALNEAIDALGALNARHARVVELRFLGGLTVEEVAEVLGVSRATVENDWAFAKAWLRRRLKEHGSV